MADENITVKITGANRQGATGSAAPSFAGSSQIESLLGPYRSPFSLGIRREARDSMLGEIARVRESQQQAINVRREAMHAARSRLIDDSANINKGLTTAKLGMRRAAEGTPAFMDWAVKHASLSHAHQDSVKQLKAINDDIEKLGKASSIADAPLKKLVREVKTLPKLEPVLGLFARQEAAAQRQQAAAQRAATNLATGISSAAARQQANAQRAVTNLVTGISSVAARQQAAAQRRVTNLTSGVGTAGMQALGLSRPPSVNALAAQLIREGMPPSMAMAQAQRMVGSPTAPTGGGGGAGLLGGGMGMLAGIATFGLGTLAGEIGFGGIGSAIGTLRDYAGKSEQYQIGAGKLARLSGSSLGKAEAFGTSGALAGRYGIDPDAALSIAGSAVRRGGVLGGIIPSMGALKGMGLENGEIGAGIGTAERYNLDPTKAADIVAAGVEKGNQRTGLRPEVFSSLLRVLERSSHAVSLSPSEAAAAAGKLTGLATPLWASGATAFTGGKAIDTFNNITSGLPDFGLGRAGAAIMMGVGGSVLGKVGMKRYLALKQGGPMADIGAFQTTLSAIGAIPEGDERTLAAYSMGVPLKDITLAGAIPSLGLAKGQKVNTLDIIGRMGAANISPADQQQGFNAIKKSLAAIPGPEKQLASIEQQKIAAGKQLVATDLWLQTKSVDLAKEFSNVASAVGSSKDFAAALDAATAIVKSFTNALKPGSGGKPSFGSDMISSLTGRGSSDAGFTDVFLELALALLFPEIGVPAAAVTGGLNLYHHLKGTAPTTTGSAASPASMPKR